MAHAEGRGLRELKQRDHLCLIHTEPSDALSVTNYLEQGLARGERCVHLSGDGSSEVSFQSLRELAVDVEHHRRVGALEALPARDTPLGAASFTPHAMIDFLRELETKALADGFVGVRISADMTCAAGAELLIEYEALLNRLLNSRSTLLCVYDRARIDGALLHEVLRTHPLIIRDRRACSNPYYELPEMVLDSEQMIGSPALLARRADWWLEQIERVKCVDDERDRVLRQLESLSSRFFELQETERRNFARELHDEVGQMLTGLRLLLKPIDASATDPINARLDQSRAIVDELLARVRGLSFDLRPAALDQLGLIPTLSALFERYTEQTGVLVSFKHNGTEERFPPAVETAVYRIVQEALTNVARHAGVAGAAVRVWKTPETLNVEIADHGRGFDPETALAQARSSGLIGMRERVMLLQGRLTIVSRPSKGTLISAELPLYGQSLRGE